MKKVFARLLTLMLSVTLACGVVAPLAGDAAANQTATSVEQGVRTAISDLDRFDQAGNMSAYYDRLAPAFRNRVPRADWLLWTTDQPHLAPTDASTIGEITVDSWTWEAGGETFDEVASVTVERTGTLDGQDSTESVDMHFVNDGTRWRLIPDLDPEEVTKAAAAADDFSYTSPFDDPDYAMIDTFWARAYHDAGLDTYKSPGGVVDVKTNAQIGAGCGTVKMIEDAGMYYCQIDSTVYYSGEFKDLIVENVGEWAWITGVAHEWGHHIQNLQHLDNSSQPELDQGFYTIELELQADCFSGMFNQDALAHGEIGDKELKESDDIMEAIGDPAGTKWDDPDAHGTSEQRIASFHNGLDNGFLGCRLDLSAE